MASIQDKILDALLPAVAFDGWTQSALNAAARTIGASTFDVRRAFPAGAVDAALYLSQRADAQMVETLHRDYTLASMKIRERIATAVMVRLRQQAPHREAVRRAVGLMLLPWNITAGTRAMYATVDAIWREAGDTSTDYNFYTKRLLLAQVYTTTAQVWLDDRTAELGETEAFLRRRIEDVMQIEKLKAKTRETVKSWMPV